MIALVHVLTYFSPSVSNELNIYSNKMEKNENELVMDKRIEKDIEYIMEWWKPKAINRFTKLYEDYPLMDDDHGNAE